MTPEQIYQLYHKYTFFFKNNTYPRVIENFDNAKEKDTWIYFTRCSDMIDRNAGQINPDIYVYSIAKFFEGWFDPKILTSPKGIKIYKSHVELINLNNEKEAIEKGVLHSIKFVNTFCHENNINNFNEYINHNKEIIPTLLKHYNAGSITIHFLAMIPNILYILKQSPQDVIDEYISTFKENYPNIRALFIHNEKLRNISDNLEQIINESIKKLKNQVY